MLLYSGRIGEDERYKIGLNFFTFIQKVYGTAHLRLSYLNILCFMLQEVRENVVGVTFVSKSFVRSIFLINNFHSTHFIMRLVDFEALEYLQYFMKFCYD